MFVWDFCKNMCVYILHIFPDVDIVQKLMMSNSTVYSGADKRKHQSSASLALKAGNSPVGGGGGGGGGGNSTHKWPVTRKMFPFDDVIMNINTYIRIKQWNVIIEPRANFNGGSGKLMLKLWHEWVIISHIYLWMQLAIHALISTLV